MYRDFYKLTSLPFENTADPTFFFDSEPHREALAALEYTVRMRKGFALITGDPGLGKTMIARMACDRCLDHATVVRVTPGHSRPGSLLGQVLAHLGQPKIDVDQDPALLFHKLENQLRAAQDQTRPIVLLADEAQTLSDEVLETLRHMSHFDTPAEKPIQVVLVGQPELRRRLSTPAHAALRQRLVLAKQLRPLTIEETHHYITHRLRAAADAAQPSAAEFSPGAVREIHRLSGGIPRLINTLCDNCLLLGFAQQQHKIGTAQVHQVSHDMMPDWDAAQPAPAARQGGLSLAGGM